MATYAAAVYPVPNRYIDLGKEVTPGTIAAATYTYPMTQFKPVDKYTMLEDTGWRNAMAQLYNLIQGVRIADVSMGGPFFADGMGYSLANILGDYWQPGVNNGTIGVSTQMSVSSVIGAGTIVVTSATSISAGELISIGGTTTTACEIRKVTNVTGTSPGTLTLSSALYQAHSSSATSGTVVAWSGYNSINHAFSLLNNGLGAGGWTASQPPTYTYYDFSGVPATSGAREYAYGCFSEVSITSEATALVNWEGKMTALASQIAGSTPSVTLSTVAPQAAWRSTVNLAGSGTLNIGEWKLSLMRKIGPLFTNSNQQDPFAIVRGYFTAGLSFKAVPVQDELEFLYYLNNTQPTVQLVATNGLSGSSSASLTVNAQVAGFDTGEINDSKEAFGYDFNAKLVANTTNTGPSGGFSPVSITLANQVTAY
jgi:hypothetical protein